VENKPEAIRPDSIRTLFSQIAKRYDLTNSVLSFGIHHLWKKKMVRVAQVLPEDRCLDCATGTGDLAFLLEKKACFVMGVDFCEPMLAIAKKKAQIKGSQVVFRLADLHEMDFEDGVFDVITLSFGIRNVASPKKVMAELTRILKPSGRLVILEFGQPYVLGFRQLYQLYSRYVLPGMGFLLSKNRQAYAYLHLSSSVFACGKNFFDAFCDLSQFQQARFESLYGGIAYLYVLKKNPLKESHV
jgi:demethylmenaquinone methyltransferase/2-methoxy-6-polyprenyl-1,4-benzoquinol methylase